MVQLKELCTLNSKKQPCYIDTADIQSVVMPGYRIRNRKKKRRVQKKVTRQTVSAMIRDELEVLA